MSDTTTISEAPPIQWSWAGALAAIALATAIAAVYSRGIDSPLFFDDQLGIKDNTSIRQLWPLIGTADAPGPLRPARDLPTSGRPVVNLSFAINYFFGGLEPRGYHVVNVVLHVLNAWLLAAVTYLTLRLPFFAQRFDQVAGVLAFAIATLWSLHPLVTETVVYTTQRTELIVTLFYFATLLLSICYLRSRWPAWSIAAGVACWLGMASKEVMVSAPVLVLLYDRTFMAGTLRAAWDKSRPFYLGLFSSWIALLLLNAGGPRANSAGFHFDITPTMWWFTQCKVLLMYLKLAIWPWPLAIYYEPPYLTSLAAAWPYVALVAAVVLVTLVLLWRNMAVGWVAAFALAILAPTSIVPIATEIAAERRMYMPLAAIIALIIVGAYSAIARRASANAALAFVAGTPVLLAIVGGFVSHQRLAVYDSELTVWQDVTNRQPDNATAHCNVGIFLMEQDRLDEAITYFERAIEIRPGDYTAHHNLGAIFTRVGRNDEATAHFKQAVAARPSYGMGHSKLGFTELKAGHPEKAQHHFEVALRWTPHDAEAYRGLATALLALGNAEEAEPHAQEAVKFAPDDGEAQNVLGAALAQLGRYPEAIEHLQQAVAIDATNLQAQGNLMAAYAGAGRRDEAIATAHKALELAEAQGDTDLAAQINAFLASIGAAPTSNAPQSNE
jgi:tetratricopeptide (TPR) repeat protein